MNKQARENMLSVIQNFIQSAPPQCDVEITVKYNLSNDNTQQVKTFNTKLNPSPTMHDRIPLMVRKLRSEERVSLKDAVPLLTPTKHTDSDEVDVSAESDLREEHGRKTKAEGEKSQSTDDMDDVPTSELFPVKKALRYNKKSGKYDKISQ